MTLQVAVIGAGIMGAACALALLRDGHRVSLIEPGEAGGEQAASYGNGAWLSPASVVPMSMPGLWRKVPGYLLDRSGPLTIRWQDLPELMPWLLRFLRAGATVQRVEATARALSALLHDSPARHRALAQAAGVADLIVPSGLLYAYADRAEFEAEALAWRLRRDNRVTWEAVEGADLRVQAPDLAERYRFAVLVRDGAYCEDPGAYVAAQVAAAERAGAKLHRASGLGFRQAGGRLVAVLTDQGEWPCDRAVIAAGIRSASLASTLGDRIPLASERGYHVMLADAPIRLPVPVMPADGKMANTQLRAGLRVAGQVELAAADSPPDWRRAEILWQHARQAYPALAACGRQPSARWLGHRPSTPDGLPVLGPSPSCGDVLLAFGHGHVGLAGAPASAELIADLVAGRTPSIEAHPYRAQRF